jgi:hypothetical protein
MTRIILLAVLTAGIMTGCGGGSTDSPPDDRGAFVTSITPRDGELGVSLVKDIVYHLSQSPIQLNTAVFYWREDTDNDQRIDYPQEVTAIETVVYYGQAEKKMLLSPFYMLDYSTVYMVLIESDGLDYSTVFVTEDPPEGRTTGKQLSAPIGIEKHMMGPEGRIKLSKQR